MSTRYVWTKWDQAKTDKVSTAGARLGYNTTEWKYLYVMTAASVTRTEDNRYQFDNPTIQRITVEKSVTLAKGLYFVAEGNRSSYYDAVLQTKTFTGIYRTRQQTVLSYEDFEFDDVAYYQQVVDQYCDWLTITTVKGSTEYGAVTAASDSTYPANGASGLYWYVYQGSDSIDPTAVSILDTPKAGKPVNVAVAPCENVYGGTITYLYQYSVDGGATWVTAGSSTAASMEIAVPADAETFAVRVRASDNMGFTSADYVTSEAVAVKAAGGAVVTIDGVAREQAMYACIDGILRPIGGQAVIDGVSREIF